MLPLQQAYEVREAVLEYIKATFRFKDGEVGKAFYRFLENPQSGLFKGPYVSLKAPFVKAQEGEEIPLEVKPPFAPHKHQVESFKRLTTENGHTPQPTLLTTGTGSGKTECFLFPVLDYVYKLNKDERRKGVKVIIMYPMNALATDQAKRMAEMIYGEDEEGKHPLRGKVTAGLLIGEGKDKSVYPTTMTREHIIENRETIVEEAPDIILTNFKMLDYALMQQRYTDLWKGNLGVENPILRFIVLDELHTYDGAQGTDVANLLRRLKLKLGLKAGQLVPVGTSATIGNGEDSKKLLCEYASDVFGEQFDEDSIIGESRLTPEDFFDNDLDLELPTSTALRELSKRFKKPQEYLSACMRVWFGHIITDKVEMGNALKRLGIMRDLLEVTSKGVILLDDLKRELGNRNSSYQAMLRTYPSLAGNVVESLLALISEAKERSKDSERKFPFLSLQIQLWQRELSGIQRFVQSEPEFTWKDSLPKDERISLPMYFCRDCGTSGWLSVKKRTENRLWSDSSKINQAFMTGDADVMLLNTCISQNKPIADYHNNLSIDEEIYVRKEDLTLGSKNDADVMKLRCVSRSYQTPGMNRPRFDNHCPICMSADTLAIIGGRTTTLSSVGVSQVMSSDFDAQDASKRKMLTFSNSVQDAAHLAGFYEVRTYRFLLRQSIQNYIKTVGHPITLAELQTGFKEYWKGKLQGEEYYYRFMPDDLIEKVDLKESYRNPLTGDFTEAFKKEFDLRVDWEIATEFGLMAQRGRTLEKMGASATFFQEEKLAECFEALTPWLQNNNMEYVAENKDVFLKFLNGILHRMRLRGGIDHEFVRKFRTKELKTFWLNWCGKGTEHFLYRRFGPKRGVPHFMGYQFVRDSNKEILDVTTVRSNKDNWHARFFMKSFKDVMPFMLMNPDLINEFYQQLMDSLLKVEVFNVKQTENGIVNYAIRPEALWIDSKVSQIKCDTCENRLFVAEADTLSEGTHCLDFTCQGEYHDIIDNEDNYYKKVYNREISPRIYASDHTGLLERSDREKLERDFKDHPTPQSCNVLAATSTLEMGIDIGDLNVVSNTGIPPKPSNFLQRVGRAGRKEGSALILNYAKGGKHDLFYYAEPMEMMEGAVSTPGCFLEAREILRRHFYAFCIDSWTSSDRNNRLEGQIQYLGLNHQSLTSNTFVINIIGDYIKANALTLLSRFGAQYPEKAQDAQAELADTVRSGKMQQRIIREFENLLGQFDHIKAEIKDIKKRLETIPANDTERRRELYEQNKGLRAKERALKEQPVVEFMTNVGLLPNYAFPETGVKLSASIYSRKALGDELENIPEPLDLELVRPASQGIRELAPDNGFYTQKMKLKVKGLSLADRTDSLRMMHYCSDCDALAEEGSPEYLLHVCPKCGSESWRSNLHKYLHFTMAITSVYKDNAALDDSNDEREQLRFHTMKHFEFRHAGPVTSYGLKNAGFGIEFCKDMTLKEVNYGNQDQHNEPTQINGNGNISNYGFVTCKYCGKSTSLVTSLDKVEDFHFPFCNHKDVGFPEDQEHLGTFEMLYLFRSMHTEAIKVLLPVQLFETEAAIAMFKAGLELGMKYYYKSSPDHLRIDPYREFNQATGQFDNYLIIYDTIPGGTGYLTKLYDVKEFTELIKISYEHIRDCECRLEGKDGCYHCILSYGNQWQRNNLSRERAEEIFKTIVDESSHWEQIDGGIGNITRSGVIEDSELEKLFEKVMARIASDRHWTWKKNVDATVESVEYELIIKEDNLRIKYIVKPQYKLGPSLGVSVMTVPDFQFVAVGAEIDGESVDVQSLPEWSVYLDGYKFHASAENMGFYNDFTRREAIRTAEGKPRLSWTLTWDDIRHYLNDDEVQDRIDSLAVSPNRDLIGDFPNSLYRMKDSLSRFIYLLRRTSLEKAREEVLGYLASCFTDDNQYISSYAEITKAVSENAKSQYSDITDEEADNGHFFVKTNFIPRNSLIGGSAWYAYDAESPISESVKYNWDIRQNLPEISQDDWKDFWRRYNLLQFFSNKELEPEEVDEHLDLDEILMYFPGLEDIVTQLVTNGIKFNVEGGYELMGDDGVLAEAAIKLDGRDIVIDDFSDRPDDRQKFESKGFQVIDVSNFNINKIND